MTQATESKVPIVSVNIPIYNGEETIGRAVKSILDQTFSDFELIVVNDGSTDSTAQILNQFSDPRMRVIHHEQNQGISRTRNTLLRNSRGEYVAVLDGDDSAFPRRLERQLRAAKHESLDGVFSWVQIFAEKNPDEIYGYARQTCEPDGAREAILFRNPYPHCSAFLKRGIMGPGYREDLPCAEDYAKWLELAFEGRRLRVLNECLFSCWHHEPINYTAEKMKSNVKKLHQEYFRKLLGRGLTDDEAESQWVLYETSQWMPATRLDAIEQLGKAAQWVETLRSAELCDPNVDRARFVREAEAKLYRMCTQSASMIGPRILGLTGRIGARERLKLLVKSTLPRFKRAI